MHSKGLVLFKLLLNRYRQDKEDGFVKVLPEQDAEQLAQLRFSATDPKLAFVQLDAWIRSIHYSWIKPYYEQLSPAIKSSLSRILPEEHIQGLCSDRQHQLQEVVDAALEVPALNETSLRDKHEDSGNSSESISLLHSISDNASPVSEITKEFLLQQLYDKWPDKELLPPQLLPETALKPLLGLKKKALVELIDLLSMYDLGEEIRYVVDRTILQRTLNHLSPKQQQFLKITLHHKTKGPLAGIKLEKLDGSQHNMKAILHRQGLQRLAIALSGHSQDFIKALCYKLDTGRGNILLRTVQNEEVPAASSIIMQQVLQVLSFLQPKVKP